MTPAFFISIPSQPPLSSNESTISKKEVVLPTQKGSMDIVDKWIEQIREAAKNNDEPLLMNLLKPIEHLHEDNCSAILTLAKRDVNPKNKIINDRINELSIKYKTNENPFVKTKELQTPLVDKLLESGLPLSSKILQKTIDLVNLVAFAPFPLLVLNDYFYMTSDKKCVKYYTGNCLENEGTEYQSGPANCTKFSQYIDCAETIKNPYPFNLTNMAIASVTTLGLLYLSSCLVSRYVSHLRTSENEKKLFFKNLNIPRD